VIADIVSDGASPMPWELWCVLSSGAFSAMAWGLATLFRPRPSFAQAPAEEDDEEEGEDPKHGPEEPPTPPV
jgi:hypothetical protein